MQSRVHDMKRDHVIVEELRDTLIAYENENKCFLGNQLSG